MAKTWKDVEGWFDFQDVYDAALTAMPGNGKFVEIGVWKGRSLIYAMQKARQMQKRVNFYAVDTWKGSPHDVLCVEAAKHDIFAEFMQNLIACGVGNEIADIFRDGSQAASNYYLNRGEFQRFDFVFIDGDHTEKGVLTDIRGWVKLVKAGGTIAGHDFQTHGVRLAVERAFGAENITVTHNTWVVKMPADPGEAKQFAKGVCNAC